MLSLPAMSEESAAAVEVPSASGAVEPSATPAPLLPSSAAPIAPVGNAPLPDVGARTEVVAAPSAPSAMLTDEKPINVDLRFDGNFFVGDGGVEGFALPSYRVSLFGDIAPRLRYRMSMGQAREFSSALLPQIVPVEAFAVFTAAGLPKRPVATVTVGLFSPSLVPWWTPDLSDLPLPDYASVHRALLPGRELGAEVSLSAIPGYLEGAVGVVNGTGIFGSQSGSTRAVTAMIRTTFGQSSWRVMLGAGGYHSSMGASGTPQYRQQTIIDVFLQLRLPRLGVTLGADWLLGKYEDAFRALSPAGGNAFVLVDVTEMLQAFGRYEFLDQWWGDTPSFRRVDVGPVLKLFPGTKLFVLVSYREAAGVSQTGGEARLRLQL